MENTGVTPTSSKIVIDVENETFSLLHTDNISVEDVYAILLLAIEYLDEMAGVPTVMPPASQIH